MSAELHLTKIKLGSNADTSKNFVISVPAVADGTLTIERENGTDVLTIDASGNVAFPSMPGFGYAPIIESGSNANGTYIKFADGTMICAGSYSIASLAVSTASLGGYRSSPTAALLTFPAEFFARPVLTAMSVGGDGISVTQGGVSTATAYLIWTAVSTQPAGDREADWIAIGRWK